MERCNFREHTLREQQAYCQIMKFDHNGHNSEQFAYHPKVPDKMIGMSYEQMVVHVASTKNCFLGNVFRTN